MSEIRKNLGVITLLSDVDLCANVTTQKQDDFITYHTLNLSWDKAALKSDSYFKLYMSLPMKTAKFHWIPMFGSSKTMPVIWRNQSVLHTNIAIDCPVVCALDENDNCVYTISLDEVKKDLVIKAGSQEYFEGPFDFSAEMKFSQLDNVTSYSITIRIDERVRYFGDALGDVREWWEKLYDITPMPTPDSARKPFYSTWYSYHKDLSSQSIEHECALAKQLGMDAVILDDGWQTGFVDLGGYSSTGDWNVCKDKFPDFALHVQKVHDMGLKYLVWFSVPFVGENSEIWNTFKDKTLKRNVGMGCRVLDPRYPEVRAYLINKYVDFAKKYGIDGFKLDFIDQFHTYEDEITEGMDTFNLYDAVEVLMTDVKDALCKVLAEPLIEFRQEYTGPIIRKFGNMLRVADCPYDGITNRIEICNIRFLAGESAVHSDMIMWNPSIPVEDAAWQLLNSMFGVIQYSVKIDSLPQTHKAMSKFWLGFAKKYRHTLQCGHLTAYEPQSHYPVITSSDDTLSITGIYGKNRIADLEQSKDSFIINASGDGVVYIKAKDRKTADIKVYDCCGSVVNEKKFDFVQGVNEIDVPKCGLLEIKLK